MSIRFEDQGVTLRLFRSKAGAEKFPNVLRSVAYGPGWIAENRDGRWVDCDGVLPPNWSPKFEVATRIEGLNIEVTESTPRKILFLKIGGVIDWAHGFASEKEANDWIDGHGRLIDWRAGYVFRLKGQAIDIEIVKKSGQRAMPR